MKLRRPLRLFRLWDVLLIVVLVALVGVTVYFALVPKEGSFAEIYVDGKLYQKVSLSKNATIELEHLTVTVTNGEVCVFDADCPDKICEKRGAISREGESIVCLPNKVVVTIAGKGEVEAIS